jgi:hypothetical protein
MERGLQEVEVRGVALDRFAEVIGPVRTEQFLSLAASSRERLAGRRVIKRELDRDGRRRC